MYYVHATWERVVKYVKITAFLAEALLQGLDQVWGARNILCRSEKIKHHLELE